MNNGKSPTPRPSAYLWGQCEGWARIGVFHVVHIDFERGQVLDEAEQVLLKRKDGLWRTVNDKHPHGGFVRIAVTHVPVDPWHMQQPGWQNRWQEMQDRRQRALEKHRDRLVKNSGIASPGEKAKGGSEQQELL